MQPADFKHHRRHTLRLTQSQLAAELDVSRATIGKLERGYLVPIVYQRALEGLMWRQVAAALN